MVKNFSSFALPSLFQKPFCRTQTCLCSSPDVAIHVAIRGSDYYVVPDFVVNFGRFCQRVIKIIRFAGVNERGSERNATRRQQSNRVKKQDTTEGGDRRRPLGRTHSFSQYYARERVYFYILLCLFP